MLIRKISWLRVDTIKCHWQVATTFVASNRREIDGAKFVTATGAPSVYRRWCCRRPIFGEASLDPTIIVVGLLATMDHRPRHLWARCVAWSLCIILLCNPEITRVLVTPITTDITLCFNFRLCFIERNVIISSSNSFDRTFSIEF